MEDDQVSFCSFRSLVLVVVIYLHLFLQGFARILPTYNIVLAGRRHVPPQYGNPKA